MNGVVTSTELCERAGIDRGVLKFWTMKLGIESSGTGFDERNQFVRLWPESAVARIKRAYGKRRKRGNGK